MMSHRGPASAAPVAGAQPPELVAVFDADRVDAELGEPHRAVGGTPRMAAECDAARSIDLMRAADRKIGPPRVV